MQRMSWILVVFLGIGATAYADEAPLPEMVVRPILLGQLQGRCRDEPLFINEANDFDVDRDGRTDIVYSATSCLSKGSGPDLSGVLQRRADNSLGPMKIPDLDVPLRQKLIGDFHYALAIEDGQLVQKFSDTSGRRNPVKLTLAWSVGKLVVQKTDTAPIYATSFDCKKVPKISADWGVCSVSLLASLDRLTAEAAKKKAQGEKLRRSFHDARQSKCPLVPGWVDCFEKNYLSELESLGMHRVVDLESKCGKGGFYFANNLAGNDLQNAKFVLSYLHSESKVDRVIEDLVPSAQRIDSAKLKSKLSDPHFEQWATPGLVKGLQLYSVSRYALETSAQELPRGPAVLSAPVVQNYLRARKDVVGQLQSRFGVTGIESGTSCD